MICTEFVERVIVVCLVQWGIDGHCMLWYMYANEMNMIPLEFQSRYRKRAIRKRLGFRRGKVYIQDFDPKESSMAR